jgi:hypothetical protein
MPLSSSWTWYPADPNTDNPYFEEFDAPGQNLFQAAGNDGAGPPPAKALKSSLTTNGVNRINALAGSASQTPGFSLSAALFRLNSPGLTVRRKAKSSLPGASSPPESPANLHNKGPDQEIRAFPF